MVREGTEADIQPCLTLARQAMNETDTYKNRTPDFEFIIQCVLQDPGHKLFVSEKPGSGAINGFLLAQVQRGLFFREIIATNVAFYVLPQYRGIVPYRLIKEFERWAREKKVDELHLGTSGGINLERNMRLFNGLGYKLSGILATKKVT